MLAPLAALLVAAAVPLGQATALPGDRCVGQSALLPIESQLNNSTV